MAYTYRVCVVYDHVYSMLQGNLNLATECQLIIDYILVNSSHQGSSLPTIHRGLHVSASLNSGHAATPD